MIKKNLWGILSLILAATLTSWAFADEIASPAVTQEVYDISTGEPLAHSLEGLRNIVEKDPELNFADDQVLTVVVPSNLDFTIDPYEVDDKGQIYSGGFFIQNYSKEDVSVKLVNIKYTFANDTDFLSLDAPPEVPFGLKNQSNLKEIYMFLRYDNRDVEDLVITDKENSESSEVILAASDYDEDGNFVALSEDSSLVFSFSGIVNHMPAVAWENKDIIVSIEYTMTTITSNIEDESKTEPTQASEPEEASAPINQEVAAEESNPEAEESLAPDETLSISNTKPESTTSQVEQTATEKSDENESAPESKAVTDGG